MSSQSRPCTAPGPGRPPGGSGSASRPSTRSRPPPAPSWWPTGPSGIQLRAVARDVGLTAPALYRYFPSLEDLVEARHRRPLR